MFFKIREGEAVTIDDFTEAHGDRVIEHRARMRKRVELAILAARIDICGQVVEQRLIEGPAGK